MTIKDLIDKLREEKDTNGCYGVLQKEYEKLIEYANQRDEAEKLLGTDPHKYLFADGCVKERYNFLDGFLWGLRAADFITADECSEFHDELWDETKK